MKILKYFFHFILLLLIFIFFFNQKIYSQKYALLIGIDYSGSSHLPLDYTGNDALKFGQILEKNYGFVVDYLTSKEKTTKKYILSFFDALKDKKYKFEQLIIFFSGHGEQDPNSFEIGYLIPSDCEMGKLTTTAIDMAIIQNLSKTINAKQILFIIDACYSGIAGSYTNMDLSGIKNLNKNLRARQIMTAGRSGQTAKIYPSLKLSIYTYYLINALDFENEYIRADQNSDGEITLWELQNYVEKKVTNHTNGKQTPRIYNYTEDDGIFVFESTRMQRSTVLYKNQLNVYDKKFTQLEFNSIINYEIEKRNKEKRILEINKALEINKQFRSNKGVLFLISALIAWGTYDIIANSEKISSERKTWDYIGLGYGTMILIGYVRTPFEDKKLRKEREHLKKEIDEMSKKSDK